MTAKLELYRVFREVAETGNISAAAQNLYISQSAVSQSVKQLEGALQTRLFIRSPRGVTLTDDGQMLFEHVRSAMGLLETGEEKLAQTRALQMGKLVIGASDTVTSQFLLPHLDSFHKKYPNIHIQIISGRSHKVLGLLRSGKVDVAFASSPSEDEGLSCVPCFATHSCFVAAADYPCDFERAYSMQELAALPLILLERKASSRVYLEKYFLAHGVSLSPEIELGARSLLVDLARIGFGVAGVTREFVTAELAQFSHIATEWTSPSSLRPVNTERAEARRHGVPLSCPTRFSTTVHSISPYCRFTVLLFDVRKTFFGNGIFLSKYVSQRCGVFSCKPSPPLLSCLIDNTVNSLLERWTSEIDDKPDPKPKHLQIGSALGAEHLVSRRLRHRLAFDNHLVLNEKVEFLGVLVSYLEDMSLVDDWYRSLSNNLKAVPL